MTCWRWSFPFLDDSCQPDLAYTLNHSSCASPGLSKPARDWFTTSPWSMGDEEAGAACPDAHDSAHPRGIRGNR